MGNRENFSELATHLRRLLRSVPYSESTYKDMDFILKAFEEYMHANALGKYSPEIGKLLVAYCEQELHVCASRVSRAKILVSKLNRIQEGYDGNEALWHDHTIPIPLPEELQKALDAFILWCRNNGNKETTVHYKRWICGKFLKNLADLGCGDAISMTGENIQTAFLQLQYSRYWKQIGPFLRFLFENSYTERNYSHLVIHRKVYPPQPTTYSTEEISAIEGSVDRSTDSGTRNYAVLLLMTRYGIRSRDVAALTFDNLDFENNRIHFIQQKTGDPWECELFPEVKTALLDYICNIRPQSLSFKEVFITLTIPHKPLDGYAINTAIWTLFRKSGVDISGRRHGGRALRSSITSNLIREGVSIEIVHKVLGHGTKHAVKSYARIDIESMRLCPLPVLPPTGSFAALLSGKEGDA